MKKTQCLTFGKTLNKNVPFLVAICADNRTEHQALLMHSEERWLSCLKSRLSKTFLKCFLLEAKHTNAYGLYKSH